MQMTMTQPRHRAWTGDAERHERPERQRGGTTSQTARDEAQSDGALAPREGVDGVALNRVFAHRRFGGGEMRLQLRIGEERARGEIGLDAGGATDRDAL